MKICETQSGIFGKIREGAFQVSFSESYSFVFIIGVSLLMNKVLYAMPYYSPLRYYLIIPNMTGAWLLLPLKFYLSALVCYVSTAIYFFQTQILLYFPDVFIYILLPRISISSIGFYEFYGFEYQSAIFQ